jgi:hypothetical protein
MKSKLEPAALGKSTITSSPAPAAPADPSAPPAAPAPVPSGFVYLTVNLLAPSPKDLRDWLFECADWAKSGGDPKRQPQCAIAKEPTQTTVRFIAELCYKPNDMWATLLSILSRISWACKGDSDYGGKWGYAIERPTPKPQKSEPVHFWHWVEDQRVNDASAVVKALRESAADFAKPETEEPSEGYGFSALHGRVSNEGGLRFCAYIALGGKEYSAKALLQVAEQIEKGVLEGSIGDDEWFLKTP